MRVVIRAPVLFVPTVNFLLGEFFDANTDLCYEALAIIARQYSYKAFDPLGKALLRLRGSLEDGWRKMHFIRFLALQSWKDGEDYLVAIESTLEDLESLFEYLQINNEVQAGKIVQLVGFVLIANDR